MDTFLFKHGNQLFIFFLFPLIGLVFDRLLSKKNNFCLLLCSAILLTPLIGDYEYIIPYTYQFFGLVCLGSLYSIFSREIDKGSTRTITASIISTLLFFILAFSAFMDSFGGNTSISESYRDGKYRVDHIISQGFAGKPYICYELNEYTIVPVLYKRIGSVQDTIDICEYKFEGNRVMFNKCQKAIKTY